MNSGDKVLITRGIYNGYVGELVSYVKDSPWATPYCRVSIPGFNFEVMLDPWDIQLAEEEDINETDTAATGNL